MNIIRLTTRIYPDKAGPSIYAFLLSKYVSNKNYKMYNITCKPEGIKEKINQVNSHFRIEYIPIKAPRWDEGYIRQLFFLGKFIIYSFKKILRIHQKFRVDLIHCDNPAITGLVSLLFNRIFRIPFIYTQHGLDSHFKLNFLMELRLIYKYSSNYIIVSRRMVKFFKKNKLDLKKLLWVPIGIELNRFFQIKNNTEKEKIISDLELNSIININDIVIIYVGYMDLKQKTLGMIDFLYSFNKFLNELNDEQKKKIKLLYIGDGKYKNLLNKEINSLNLKSNVFPLGIKFEIEKFYAISNFLALTSYMEGFPTVLLEATASNIPCICTDVGEVREILDENSIVPCGDIDAIASKLKHLYKNKDLCESITKNSQNKIKKFSWTIIAKEYRKIYKKVIFYDKKKEQ